MSSIGNGILRISKKSFCVLNQVFPKTFSLIQWRSCANTILSLWLMATAENVRFHELWQNLKGPVREPHQGQSAASWPGCGVPARGWLTRWHWLLGCHRGRRVLSLMTGQGRACSLIVFLRTQDALEKACNSANLLFWRCVIWEFSADLVRAAAGRRPSAATKTKPGI